MRFEQILDLDLIQLAQAAVWGAKIEKRASLYTCRPPLGVSTEISAEIPDWTREQPRDFWDPGRKSLRAIRDYQRWQQSNRALKNLACKWIIVRYRLWSVVSGADIPLDCKIGGGLLLNHPNGIVIHPDAVIGVNCLIFQQVTIGATEKGVPEIGGHVDIGAGAKVIGRVKIGKNAIIGANAVVVDDVETGATVVGVPARNVRESRSLRLALSCFSVVVKLDFQHHEFPIRS